MIRIIVNNQEVYLDPKTSIRFDLVHPAFESEYLHASMVYPFDIPAFKNESIFSHSNHIVVNKKYRIYDCIFSFADSINFNGKLVLSKLSKTSFRGSIIMNGFSVDSKDISLQDFNYDNDVTLGADTAAVAAYIEGVVDNSYPTTNFNFPYIHVPNWYGENPQYNPDFQNYVNFWMRTAGLIRQNIISETAPDNYNSILPCIYLMYVIDKCFGELGFKVSGDFLTHAELSQLIIFYNTPLDFGENKYTIKASNSADQYIDVLAWVQLQFDDDSTPPNTDPDGAWSTTNHYYIIKNQGFHHFEVNGFAKNRDAGIPFYIFMSIVIKDETDNVTLKQLNYTCDALDEIEISISTDVEYFIPARVGNLIKVYVKCWYTDGEDTDFSADFRFHHMVIDGKNTSIGNFNSFKTDLHYADHVPDISFGKFISAISQAFGLYFLFDHEKRIVEINFLKDLIGSHNFIDLTNCMIKDSYEIMLQDSVGYNYQFKWDGADFPEEDYYTIINPDKYIGDYDSFQDLPIPTDLNVFAYVRNLNAYYLYSSVEDKTGWEYYCFNYKPFIVPPSANEKTIDFAPLMIKFEDIGYEDVPTTQIKC